MPSRAEILEPATQELQSILLPIFTTPIFADGGFMILGMERW